MTTTLYRFHIELSDVQRSVYESLDFRVAQHPSEAVKVYTYKSPDLMMKDLREEKIHRAEEIEFYSVSPSFLEELIPLLKKDNRWDVIFNEGTLTIQAGEKSVSGEICTHSM